MNRPATLDTAPDTSKVQRKAFSRNVEHYLQLIQDNDSAKTAQDAKNILIRDMVERGFEVKELNGPRRINVKKLYQVWLKAVQRIQVLDYTIHGTNRPEYVEQVVTGGVSTVLKKGGYIKMFRDKGGLFQNGLGYGYAFGMFGTRDDKGSSKGFPFKFTALPNDAVYVDSRATAMRSGNKPVMRAGIVTMFTYDQLIQKWPEAKGQVLPGMIPRTTSDRDFDMSENQEINLSSNVEVFYGYDIVHKDYTVFAGRNCFELEHKSGETGANKYPFTFENKDYGEEEAYIPLLHFTCMPSFKGFYDHGIFDAIYDLSVLYSQIFNMITQQTIDPSNFMKFFTTPKGAAGDVMKKINDAARLMGKGKTGVVALEYDPNNPGAGQVGVQSMKIQSMIEEANALFDRIDLEVRRFGLQLDDTPDDALATEIMANEENANRLVKYIMETNASEMEYFLKIVLDQIPKTVKADKIETDEAGNPVLDMEGQPVFKPGDTTPILLTTKIRVPMGEQEVMVRPDGMTLGKLAQELSEHEYFVKMNEKSGGEQSKLRVRRLENVLARTPVGSAAYYELLSQYAGTQDIDQSAEAFGAQNGGMPGGAPTPGSEPIGATEPQTFNPRKKQQVPAMV